jgi:hypothetical protein
MRPANPSRRALIGGAGLAAIVVAAPVLVSATGTPAVVSSTGADPQWRTVVNDFRTKHAAWMATIGLEDDQADAFRKACVSLGPEPKGPEPSLPVDIRHMTITQIKAVSDTPENKAAWAAYERDHTAWKKKRDVLRERIFGPAKAQYDAAYKANDAAFCTLVDYPVRSLTDLGQKTEIIAQDYAGGEIPVEYLDSILSDMRRLAGREG